MCGLCNEQQKQPALGCCLSSTADEFHRVVLASTSNALVKEYDVLLWCDVRVKDRRSSHSVRQYPCHGGAATPPE